MADTYTKQQFVTAFLRDIGRLDLLQEARPEDAKYLKERYDNVIAELSDDDVVYWPDDEIPREVFEALLVFFNIMCAGSYGIPDIPKTLVFDALEKAKLRIRRRVVKVSSDEPQAEEDGYF